MAVQRFMTNDTAPGGFTLPSTSGYAAVGSSTANALAAAPAGTAATSQVAETSTSQPLLLLARRFVSDPMLSAGDFGGAWNMVVGYNENNSLGDLFFRMVIRVFSNDGTTERGSGYVFNAPSEMGTTLIGVAHSGTISTPWTCSVGDRILIEVGATSTNVSATSYQANIRRGGTDATPLVAGDTGTNVNARSGWISFTDSSADARFSAVTALPGGPFLAY